MERSSCRSPVASVNLLGRAAVDNVQFTPGDESESTFKHPCGDVAVPVENAPYVDVVVAIKIENEIGITWQRPAPQSGNIQLVGISG
jgi:hypothetical protein